MPKKSRMKFDWNLTRKSLGQKKRDLNLLFKGLKRLKYGSKWSKTVLECLIKLLNMQSYLISDIDSLL